MSPTILRTRNLRVVVYPKDHSPPHVHVFGPDQEAKFSIDPIECLYSRGFAQVALRQILLEAWHEYRD